MKITVPAVVIAKDVQVVLSLESLGRVCFTVEGEKVPFMIIHAIPLRSAVNALNDYRKRM